MGRHSRSRSRSRSFDRYLEDKRRESKSRRKEEKKKRKERENSEERRERRLDKKRRKVSGFSCSSFNLRLQEEREEDKVAKIELPGHLQYSDLNNPFNDANLTKTFVWEKKLKTEGNSGLSKKEIERM